jgi:hydroxymethylbilane synthase
MSVCRTLRIGARRSPLSRVQTEHVGAALQALDPGLRLEYLFIEASGDRSPDPSAARVTARGGFTADLGELLDAGAIDLAVHSWKDLPLPARAGTSVRATLPRADARDVLLIRRSVLEGSAPPQGLTILSSSARRRLHLENFLGWALPLRDLSIRFAPVRGDIGARLSKLLRGDGDALVIAKAAIDRLLAADPQRLGASGVIEPARLLETQRIVREALQACRAIVLPLSQCPAAPAQGALAIEARRDTGLGALLDAVNDVATFETVMAERATAATLGDDEPLGVTRLRFEYGDVEFVRGVRAGLPFDAQTLHRRGPSLPRPASADRVWLDAEQDGAARERLPLHVEPRTFDAATGLLVARSEALPYGSFVAPQTPLWTAGLATWRKLADRDLWVVGSDESLGETGATAIRPWYPDVRQWFKLSHADGHWTPFADFVATYRTRRRHALASVERYSHFYWNSGTQLRDYLRAFPQLRDAWHGCGPGNTYQIARELLGAERVRPFLNAAQFRAELLA